MCSFYPFFKIDYRRAPHFKIASFGLAESAKSRSQFFIRVLLIYSEHIVSFQIRCQILQPAYNNIELPLYYAELVEYGGYAASARSQISGAK
jgi:hypothetical protein